MLSPSEVRELIIRGKQSLLDAESALREGGTVPIRYTTVAHELVEAQDGADRALLELDTASLSGN